MSESVPFTSQQEEFFSLWGEGIAVLAGAGSGKSTALVEKCRRLLERDPSARFLAVSFTEKSAFDLERKLSLALGLSPAELARRHGVGTIHQLCLRIAGEHPRSAGLEGEERVLDDAERHSLWERALEALWSGALPEGHKAAFARVLERESVEHVSKAIERIRTFRAFGIEERGGGEDPFARDLLLLADLVLERYARLKRARGAIDYDDMERAALRALSDERVRALYHQRYALVLVDEAQDTNPLQARILERFARPGFQNLVWIGDPKQSIYGFRDADVRLFEEIAGRLPKRVSFTRNFRSRPGVLEFCNAVCAPLFEANGLRYEALEPARDPVPTPAVEGWRVREPRDLVRHLRAEQARGVGLGDVALLLRKVRGSEKWLKALEEAGIRLSISGGGPFWEDPRVREMAALLRAWSSPAYALSAAVFLRAPWVGVADSTLDEWARAGREKPLLDRFLATAHPLAERLRPLRGTAIRPGELLLALLDVGGIEEELGAPLLGLWHRAEGLAREGLSFAGVAERFRHSIESGKRETDVPPPRAEGVLPVFTIHSAKGLEFPHVLLLDFRGKEKAPSAPLVFFDRERGIHVARRTEDGKRDADSPEEAPWRKLLRERELRESLRIFYVALTRAEERLLLAVTEEDEEKKPPKKEPPPRHERIDWRAWILEEPRARDLIAWKEPEEAPPRVAEPKTPPAPSRAAEAVPLLRSRIGVTELVRLGACARQIEWSVYRPRITPLSLEIDPGAERKLGTEVHAALERVDEDALRAVEKKWGSAKFQADPLLAWARASPAMDPSRPAWSELKFEVKRPDGILTGAMDRVVETADGYEILDFKVLAHGKEDEALLRSYRDAMRIYAWALGELEPAARGRTKATLIAIDPGSVRTVDVPLPPREETEDGITRLFQASRALAAGEPGLATPGKHCRHCPFRDGTCGAALRDLAIP